MRFFVTLAVLLAAGCQDDNRDIRADSNREIADVAALRAELAALKAQLGMLPPDSAGMVKSLETRVAAIEAVVAKMGGAKQLHRIGGNGEDLGIGSPGSPTVFIPALGLEVDYTTAAVFVYQSPDCTGTPYVDPPVDHIGAAFGFVGPNGNIMTANPVSIKSANWGSYGSLSSKCRPFGVSVGAYETWTDTGVEFHSYPMTSTRLEER